MIYIIILNIIGLISLYIIIKYPNFEIKNIPSIILLSCYIMLFYSFFLLLKIFDWIVNFKHKFKTFIFLSLLTCCIKSYNYNNKMINTIFNKHYYTQLLNNEVQSYINSISSNSKLNANSITEICNKYDLEITFFISSRTT